MSVTLSSVFPSGGDFITRSASGGSISSGNTGTLVTLTPPSGQRVRLTHLSTTSGSTQAGISVAVGSNTLINALTVSGGTPNAASRFSLGNFQPYAAGDPPFGNYKQFTGKVGEALTIVKNAGNTSQTIYYGYEFGL